MKVCPTCNARVPDHAAVCRSCDHPFDEDGPADKETIKGLPVGEDANAANKTLMGAPVVGGEELDSEEDD